MNKTRIIFPLILSILGLCLPIFLLGCSNAGNEEAGTQYTDHPKDMFNLISTSYAVQTLQALDTDLPQDLVDISVRNMVYELENNVQSLDIDGIARRIELLEKLGEPIPNKEGIVQRMKDLQNQEGLFFTSIESEQLRLEQIKTNPSEQYASGYTLPQYYGTYIFNVIDEPVPNSSKLSRWLEENWEYSTQNTTSPHHYSYLYESLSILNPNYDKLDQTWEMMLKDIEPFTNSESQLYKLRMVEIEAMIRVAKKEGITPERWPEEIKLLVREGLQSQNPDGGYELFLVGDSDWAGTFTMISIANYFGYEIPQKSTLVDFLYEHQTENGDFRAMFWKN